MQVAGSWPGSQTESSDPLTLSAGEGVISLNIKVAASQIKLWWPAGVGMGTQPLYNISATWTALPLRATTGNGTTGSIAAAAVACDPGCGPSNSCCDHDKCPSAYPVSTKVKGDCCFLWAGDCQTCCKAAAPPPPPPTPLPPPTTAVRRMGFRVSALVTINDTDAATVAASKNASGTVRQSLFLCT